MKNLRDKKGVSGILKRFAIYTGILTFSLLLFSFVLFRLLHATTNSAVLYVLKDDSGLRLARDISFQEADSLLFRLDATGLFNKLFETVVSATQTPLLDLSYDTIKGRGLIKEFRPDGTRLEIALSRHTEREGEPAGVIIGGDFPPGDSGMQREGGGMAVFDGSRWIHIWCTANEGIAVSRGGAVYEPHKWNYITSRVVKKDDREVIIESTHDVSLNSDPVLITRRLSHHAGDDFVTLMIRIANAGERAIFYDYAYGDEPWLGRFGSSEGEVGWDEGGLISREQYIDPSRSSFAGFADVGNREAGEPRGYSGYANYIQWSGVRPTMVYISNDFYSVRNRLLDSRDNRILNIVWKDQYLVPGQDMTYFLKIGFLRPGQNLAEAGRLLASSNGLPELPTR